ncbi:sensor histidine kinase [Rhizomonospora bruguierae]|uniref:sensor histidine kinase n=1 Tax=Rhizomonospora bruguierae TaxID=1581705 RepID=UPI001BD0EC2B|nr:histidine kinase [Micromonospora sp. NBRC 107566]
MRLPLLARRFLLVAAVVAAEAVLLAGVHDGAVPAVAMVAYAAGVALLVGAGRRWPYAAFGGAIVLGALTGAGYALLIWSAYRAGRRVASRRDAAVAAGLAAGGLGAVLARAPDPRLLPQFATAYLVFVALPLLTGRYVAQQERLVTALDRSNRHLRRERELLGERERLRERLRIARDMHDSLGRRLSLVSMQAAALEVAALPQAHRAAARRLAEAARDAAAELYDVVGALRAAEPPGPDRIPALVAEYRAAGVPVTLHRRGTPVDLSMLAGEAAYRAVEEGVTNAAKHAPGRPVEVRLAWEADALLLTVTNPLGDGTGAGSGQGLRGLGERMSAAGGLLDHRRAGGEFRLGAMLPAAAPAPDPDLPGGRLRTTAVGVAAACLMFVVLPAGLLLGPA